MNTQQTADAIASQFGTLTATFDGKSESATATADLPDLIVKLALLVLPPSGVLDIAVGQMRADVLDFPVQLLRDPVKMKGRGRALYAWIDALRDKLEEHVRLGLSYVEQARCIDLRAEIEGESYASALGVVATFDVVEITVRVHFREPIPGLGV